ncbi:MAG: cupredoxin domain-containing protein [Solirubrobacterales bacterium]|nr:cupredoxin domain-containing protein [Solirubrobacterales bacterium]
MRRGALATCLALAVAGCGSDEPASSGDKPAAEKAPNAVGMKNTAFDPGQITVKAGDTVNWVNDEEVEHNVVATDGATFKSDTFGKDGTFKVKTEKPGKISYVCTIHEGMGGSITVE